MPATIAEMSPDQFESFMGAIIERKLKEILPNWLPDNGIEYDPDEGLELRPEVRERLLRLQAEVRAGRRGISSSEIEREFGV